MKYALTLAGMLALALTASATDYYQQQVVVQKVVQPVVVQKVVEVQKVQVVEKVQVQKVVVQKQQHGGYLGRLLSRYLGR